MAENTAATPCECSLYEAFDNEQLTDENIASGDYDIFTTGCIATTKRTFAPGHDAKLKSFLIKHDALGSDIRRNEGGVAVSASAVQLASRYEFAHLVSAGIAKATEKAQARATRAAAKAERAAKPKATKADAPGGTTHRSYVNPADLEHDGNQARQAREAKSLAEVVAAEEAKHAAEQVASRPAPEWDDAPAGEVIAEVQDSAVAKVTAKVGRWEYQGFVDEDGKFRYTDKKGRAMRAPGGTYTLATA